MFLSWIPYGYIFETQIIEILLEHFFVVPALRNETILCFVEIEALEIDENEPNFKVYLEKQCITYCKFVHKVLEFTSGANLAEEYSKVHSRQAQNFERFCRHLSLLLSGFLKNNLRRLEEVCEAAPMSETTHAFEASIKQGLFYMLQMSSIPEDELFKICVEFWNFFTYHVFVTGYHAGDDKEIGMSVPDSQGAFSSPQPPKPPALLLNNSNLQQHVYPPVLDELVVVL